MDGYVDLELSKEEIAENYNAPLSFEVQKYPYGTSFSLDERTLAEVDHEDWKVGDLFHFHIMAKITGINSHENQEGAKKCVNFQMTAIKGESESEEDRKDEYEEKQPLAKHGYYT